jgi:hypothetical protein
MELIPADFVSAQDKEMRRILDEHPLLKWEITLLVNSYRDLVNAWIEEAHNYEASNGETWDVADIMISCDKNDVVMQRLGLPLLKDANEWMQVRELWYEAAQALIGE